MKILMIGGTVFLGRHLAEAALQQGHELTLFNRGEHNPDLFPGATRLRGDRNGDLSVLRGGRWDAAIDTCGYFPRQVRSMTAMLAPAVEHYTFISTLSVYDGYCEAGQDENASVGTIDDPDLEVITGESYGPLKALCDQAALEAMPGRALVIRPGLIVGPHDPSDRFTYWPNRVAQGGEVLAPDRPEHAVQLIDVRDLAEWTLRMVERAQTGIYNADSQPGTTTMGDVLHSCRAESGSDAQFTWVSEDFLAAHEIGPWMDLPLWVPNTDEYRGFCDFDSSKAIAAGLTYRPIADTVRATLAWDRIRPADVERKAGISREREQDVLTAWKKRATELAATP